MLRIIDVAGQQVADLICFRLDDYGDKLSVHNTLLLNQTITSRPAHAAVHRVHDNDDHRRGHVGVHDLIAGSCSEHTNAVRYGVRGTPNCRRNSSWRWRLRIPMREIPYSFNIFMNVPVTTSDEDHRAGVGPGRPDRPARQVDLLVAISNCPQQRNPCNAFVPTEMKALVYSRRTRGVRPARPTVTSTTGVTLPRASARVTCAGSDPITASYGV